MSQSRSSQTPDPALARQLLRREFLSSCSVGLGSAALGSLLHGDGALADEIADKITGKKGPKTSNTNPLQPREPHYKPKAKAVIQLFMAGGPSQLELFDYKPQLQRLSGKTPPESFLKDNRFAFLKPDTKLLGTARKFKRYGECGMEMAEMIPHVGSIADKIALVKTMKTDNFNHGPAKLLAQTGYQTFGYPSAGAWALYGLGSECDNLPGFVVLLSGNRGPRGGSYLWSSGFLSSVYQGVPLRNQGDPILNLTSPKGVGRSRQGRTVDAISKLNSLRHQATGDPEINTRTASYEMAFRMQQSAPELIDVTDETQETLNLYGAKPGVSSFAFNCLLARRLVERGVRFVTLFHTDWDTHGGGENLEAHFDKLCRQTDQPSAALVKDLERRGMLDETLVIWGGEFGRTPMGEKRATLGRDHHIATYAQWLAGGGIKGGQTLGSTDEFGFQPTEPKESVHVHDLHATMLHLLGLDHLRLTYRFQGRDFRLTDVHGKLVKQLLA